MERMIPAEVGITSDVEIASAPPASDGNQPQKASECQSLELSGELQMQQQDIQHTGTSSVAKTTSTKSNLRRISLALNPSSADDQVRTMVTWTQTIVQQTIPRAKHDILRILNLLWVPCLANNLAVFFCSDKSSDPDSKQFLNAAPEITCWEGVHWSMVVIALLSLLLHSFGVWAGSVGALLHARKNNLLSTPAFAGACNALSTCLRIANCL